MTDLVLAAHRDAPADCGLRIMPAHQQREWMTDTPLLNGEGKGYANRCLPLLMANQLGWDVVATQEHVITAMPNGYVSIVGPQVPNGPRNNFGSSIVTWPCPWVFGTPEGWDLLVLPPPNIALPAGVTVLSGLVETDHAHTRFTFNWLLRPLTAVAVEPGMVIARVLPYPTGELERFTLAEDTDVPEGHEEWIETRRDDTRRMNTSDKDWPRRYWDGAKRRKLRR